MEKQAKLSFSNTAAELTLFLNAFHEKGLGTIETDTLGAEKRSTKFLDRLKKQFEPVVQNRIF